MPTTDRDKIVALLDELGVVHRTDEFGSVVVESGAGPKNSGYSGFLTSFELNPDGSLKAMGAWE